MNNASLFTWQYFKMMGTKKIVSATMSVLPCLPFMSADAVFLIKVICTLQANNLGVGVVGVIECDFLQPTHNKQDFDYTKAYRYSMKKYKVAFMSKF